jgi:hypothetical protein
MKIQVGFMSVIWVLLSYPLFDSAYVGYGSKNMLNIIEVNIAISHTGTFRSFFNPKLLGFLG